MMAEAIRACPDAGTFLELLWGHPWDRAQMWAQEELANYGGGDPQRPLFRLNSTCGNCSSQLHLTVDHGLAVHKAMYTARSNPDFPIYFRRYRTAMLAVGQDEYEFGWGDETPEEHNHET